MSDTTIDDILYGVAEECGTINYDISEAKSALYDLILKEVVGEDEPLPIDDREWDAVKYRNHLRQEMRNKLKGLFDE